MLSVRGIVRRRRAGTENPNLKTGEIEVAAKEIEVLNASKTLPFQVSDEAQMASVDETLRVKYRYLDLRRPAMYQMLELRHRAVKLIRDYHGRRGFLEIETPIFTKSTPEGARDYLVPYRLEPGQFYALPQSPQQYKQLLMVAGCERYFQIARCFRDEAQRADRQPEFTQLDVEMSFVAQEDVLQLIERMTIDVVRAAAAIKQMLKPFPRLTYDEAMRPLRQRQARPALRPGAGRPERDRARHRSSASSRARWKTAGRSRRCAIRAGRACRAKRWTTWASSARSSARRGWRPSP